MEIDVKIYDSDWPYIVRLYINDNNIVKDYTVPDEEDIPHAIAYLISAYSPVTCYWITIL